MADPDDRESAAAALRALVEPFVAVSIGGPLLAARGGSTGAAGRLSELAQRFAGRA